MNYLGHLYFSNDDWELMQFNLMGDFIKGKDLLRWDPKVQHGTALHRAIDSFIDSHPTVKEMQRSLYAELPKISSVAIDLYFDHLLAKHWDDYHPQPLNDFLDTFYAHAQLDHPLFTPEFRTLLDNMIKINWIAVYPTLDGLEKMCRGVAQRISFPNQLATGRQVFERHHAEIEDAFRIFMRDANRYFADFHNESSGK